MGFSGCQQKSPRRLVMSPRGSLLFFILFLINIYAFVNCDAGTSLASGEQVESPSLPRFPSSPADSFVPLSLMSSFPEDLEISNYCLELLGLFSQRYSDYVKCLVPAARPVRVCLKCYSGYGSLLNAYTNISSNQMGPGNESCRDSLLRSDRLMLVYVLFSNMQDLWEKSNCDFCITEKFQNVNNETLNFMKNLNQTLSCFEKYQQGNHTELCKNCKSSYKGLNELYSKMEKTLCIDVEDAMNMTRILWSKNFNCSLPRDETVPVIAVSSFMLFLPVIFYLSSFLHSEQKKRKLIQPKRLKSYTSLMNIQDKQS
ncbi:Osteopetrosis-associated transmembrane protein 1 [Oryzias melastigma]|uniref:Osteopetrosis-associated transmembrane protein 1 n=1 Tax=Oryzias melastigma TaxID=30732 RepID=A0A834FNU2_ORYME|nr:Osteopetrosis-associated transmembrane protein 1 [Oryzias melastigma]